MNLAKYYVPATIAAALHAALALGFSSNPCLPPDIRVVTIALKPLPITDPVYPPPPEDPVPADAVKRLPAEGEPLPQIPDRPLAHVTLEVPAPETPTMPRLPDHAKLIAPGEGGIGPKLPGPSTIGIPDAPSLDRIPRALTQIPPSYPAEMRAAGIRGSVLVEFVADTTGQVASARAIKSSRIDFEAPAVRAVLKWRFEPGRRNGHIVPFRMVVPIEFNLAGD